MAAVGCYSVHDWLAQAGLGHHAPAFAGTSEAEFRSLLMQVMPPSPRYVAGKSPDSTAGQHANMHVPEQSKHKHTRQVSKGVGPTYIAFQAFVRSCDKCGVQCQVFMCNTMLMAP